MQGSERDEPDASYPELTDALGVLRDAYRQVEPPFVFKPDADAVSLRRGPMIRRRIFTLASGALATAAGIVLAFTVAVEPVRVQVHPTNVVTRSTPTPRTQVQVAAAKTAGPSAKVSLAVPLWDARWSVPSTTPASRSIRGGSSNRANAGQSRPSLTAFTRKPLFKTPSLTLTPRRKSNAVDRTSYLDVHDSLPADPAAGCPV